MVIDSRTEKTSCNDDDLYLISDSADSNVSKKQKFSTIKSGIQNSFNALENNIVGMIMSNNGSDLVNDVDFTEGYCKDDTYTQIIHTTALTKKLDATFTAGTNQGMLDTGTKAVSTVYYVFTIGKTTDLTVGDKLASTSSTSPTMPSGWDVKRLTDILQTDGSGNIIRGSWWREANTLYFRYRTPIVDLPFATLSAGDTRRLLTSTAPINSYGDYLFKCSDQAHTSVYLTWGATFEEDVKPMSLDTCKIGTDGNGWVVYSVNENIPVDSSRQIFYRADEPAELNLGIICTGYHYNL